MAAKGLGIPPSELLDRAAHGDLDVQYAIAASAALENKRAERWTSLFKMLKRIFS